jgi:hypothetical protein
MQVFVLLGDNGYDGQEVLGVYESQQSAFQAALHYAGDFANEGYVVERRELGAAAQAGFLENFRERLPFRQMTPQALV